jgi:hypothetical protein
MKIIIIPDVTLAADVQNGETGRRELQPIAVVDLLAIDDGSTDFDATESGANAGRQAGTGRRFFGSGQTYSTADKKQAPGYDPYAGLKEMLNRRKDNGRVD